MGICDCFNARKRCWNYAKRIAVNEVEVSPRIHRVVQEGHIIWGLEAEFNWKYADGTQKAYIKEYDGSFKITPEMRREANRRLLSHLIGIYEKTGAKITGAKRFR